MKIKFMTAAGAAVIAATLVLTGCSSSTSTVEDEAPNEAAAGGELAIAWNAQPPSLDPVFTTATATRDIANNVFEGLFALNANSEPQPMLAEGFETNDDFTVYTIPLRQGVKFHNGKEMTSADVKASLDRWIKDSTIGKQEFSDVTVTAVDDYTVELSSPVPFFTMIELMNPPNQGLVIAPVESIEAIGETGMPEESIIGTGPYQFVEWVKDQHITLDRFEDYQSREEESSGYAGAKNAYLDTLTFNFVPDVTTRVNGLQTGEYDFATELPADNKAQLDSTGLTTTTEFVYQYVFAINKASGFFSNPEARQALYVATDPTPIMTAAYTGPEFFELNGGINLPTQTAWFTEAGTEGRYDAADSEKAKELFEAAGYAGEPIRILTTRDYPDSYNGAVVMEQQLKAAGLDAQLEVADQATVLAKRGESEGWDLYPTALGFGAPETFLPVLSSWAGATDSEEIRTALADIKKSTTAEEAFSARERLQTAFYEYGAAVKVGDASVMRGYSADFDGYDYLYGPIFYNVFESK